MTLHDGRVVNAAFTSAGLVPILGNKRDGNPSV